MGMECLAQHCVAGGAELGLLAAPKHTFDHSCSEAVSETATLRQWAREPLGSHIWRGLCCPPCH